MGFHMGFTTSMIEGAWSVILGHWTFTINADMFTLPQCAQPSSSLIIKFKESCDNGVTRCNTLEIYRCSASMESPLAKTSAVDPNFGFPW